MKNNTNRNRKLTKSGGICIPSDIRTRLGISSGEYVSITVNEDGSILLKPRTQFCYFCTEETTVTFEGTPICKQCAEKIASLSFPSENQEPLPEPTPLPKPTKLPIPKKSLASKKTTKSKPHKK